MSYKIGQGYDAHQLKANLPLILGGVKIKHHKGVVAHSDGDVLAHAIADSILGALALGDIGHFFPENGTLRFKNSNFIKRMESQTPKRKFQILDCK